MVATRYTVTPPSQVSQTAATTAISQPADAPAATLGNARWCDGVQAIALAPIAKPIILVHVLFVLPQWSHDTIVKSRLLKLEHAV